MQAFDWAAFGDFLWDFAVAFVGFVPGLIAAAVGFFRSLFGGAA